MYDISVQGRLARRNNNSINDNPHKTFTNNILVSYCPHLAWERGWIKEDKRLKEKGVL
jgi:hypothetical protein